MSVRRPEQGDKLLVPLESRKGSEENVVVEGGRALHMFLIYGVKVKGGRWAQRKEGRSTTNIHLSLSGKNWTFVCKMSC